MQKLEIINEIKEKNVLCDTLNSYTILTKINANEYNLKIHLICPNSNNTLEENINFNELIEEELDKLSVRINKKKVNVETKLTKDDIVNADKKQITRVIENVLTNGVKFCKKEKIIKIKTYVKDGYFYYEVFNSGDNIKDKDKENIFNSGSGRYGLFTANESGCTTCDKGHCTAGVVHGCRTDAPAFGADLPQGCIRDIALER